MVARDGLAPAGIPMRSNAYKRSSRLMMNSGAELTRLPMTSGKDSPIQSIPGALEAFSNGRINRIWVERKACCCWPAEDENIPVVRTIAKSEPIKADFLTATKNYK